MSDPVPTPLPACPTCGSDDPAKRLAVVPHERWADGAVEVTRFNEEQPCPDQFHTPDPPAEHREADLFEHYPELGEQWWCETCVELASDQPCQKCGGVPRRIKVVPASLVAQAAAERDLARTEGRLARESAAANSRIIDELREALEPRQKAIDKAISALRSTAYVGGLNEREAYRAIEDALGPFETQHVAQGEPPHA